MSPNEGCLMCKVEAYFLAQNWLKIVFAELSIRTRSAESEIARLRSHS